MNSSKVVTTQPEPIISYLDKSSKDIEINSHKNGCEKWCTCNSTAERYPVNCSEFIDMFKLTDDHENGVKKFGLCSFICFPFTLPFNTIMCGPCALYNVMRNKCGNNEKSKNYLC
jgi:hypothetical protein